MDSLATVADVEILLDTPIDIDEEPVVKLLLDEASDLVRAWTGKDFRAQVPGGVVRATARIVARALSEGGGNVPVGTVTESQSAGAFSTNRSFEAGSTDGGVWLSRQDKIKLRRWKGGAFTIKTW